MNHHKLYRINTPEYQQELQTPYSSPKSRLKLTVEPFSIERPFFDPSKHDFTVTAHKDGEEIGTMAITHRDGGITPYQFYVKKEHRRSGIGTALANKAIDWAKKPIIPNLNMNSDAVAWFKKYHEKDIKKSLTDSFELLIKSDDYAKKASTGLILLHPISINGKTHRENGIPMHMTVKFFGDNTQVDPTEVEKHLENFSIPQNVDVNKMLFMPHTLSTPAGTHHVLLAYGAPHHVDQIRKGSEKYGPYVKNFLPHISVDKADWDKFAKMGPMLTADKIGIQIHPAELKSGNQVLKRY